MRSVAIISVFFSLLLSANAVDEGLQYLQAYIGAYPGSNSSAGGSVILQFAPPSTTEKEGMITIVMDVYNIAPNCNKNNDAPNGCGIHIHNGTSNCDNATTVGPHFWNKTKHPDDPWLTVKYDSFANGRSTSVIEMSDGNGFNATVNDNHNIVIHDAEGNRTACGVLRFLLQQPKDMTKSLSKKAKRRPKKAKTLPKAADKSTPKTTKGSDSNPANHEAVPENSNLVKEELNRERKKTKEVGRKKSAKKRS